MPLKTPVACRALDAANPGTPGPENELDVSIHCDLATPGTLVSGEFNIDARI
jgi:hypothetical protein